LRSADVRGTARESGSETASLIRRYATAALGIVAVSALGYAITQRAAQPVAPLTDRHPDLVIDDAYAIQTINIDRRTGAGQRIVGRKVGLTSRPMQEMLGVDEPDFGVLTDEMIVEDGDLIPLSRLVQPRVEAELAFVMARDLAGPGVSTAVALDASDELVVGTTNGVFSFVNRTRLLPPR